jgi:hypothetical protein
MGWLVANWKLLAGAVLSLALIVGAAKLYRDGREAGKAAVRTEVQTETIKKLEDARISKEKTDEEVVRTPYDDRVDGLR